MTCPQDIIMLLSLKPKWPCQTSAAKYLTVMSEQPNAKVFSKRQSLEKGQEKAYRNEVTCPKWCSMVKADMVGGSKKWNLEHHRINNARESLFHWLWVGPWSVYKRIIRPETVRTKVATAASCEYIQFCLFLLSRTFSLQKRNLRSWKIIWTLPFTTFFPCFFSLPFAEMLLAKAYENAVTGYSCAIVLPELSFCNYLTATTQHFLILCNALFN